METSLLPSASKLAAIPFQDRSAGFDSMYHIVSGLSAVPCDYPATHQVAALWFLNLKRDAISCILNEFKTFDCE